MLFDIRGRRRNVIRVVYGTLALLMGASLFLVIGPFNLADIVNSGSSSDAAKVLNEQAERTERKLQADPDNETLLLSLTRTRIAAGNSLSEVNPETGTSVPTAEGQREMQRAVEAWESYLKQANEPNPSAALLVANTYFGLAESSGGLEDVTANIESAADTQRIAAEARPNINTLSNLAIFEYYAGNFAAGDKATKQAEAMATAKAEAKEVSKQMAQYKKLGKEFASRKKQIEKQEGSQRKESLENPLGGLGGSSFGP
jgi:hypothetical protein